MYDLQIIVPQLEIMHGVLNDVGSNKDRAFFYLREPKTRESFSSDKEFQVCDICLDMLLSQLGLFFCFCNVFQYDFVMQVRTIVMN